MNDVPTEEEIMALADEIVDLAYDMRFQEWAALDQMDRNALADSDSFSPDIDSANPASDLDQAEQQFRETGEFDDIPRMFKQFTKGNIPDLESMYEGVKSAREMLFAEDSLATGDQTDTGMTELTALFNDWGGTAATNFKEKFAAPFPQAMVNHNYLLRWLERNLTGAKDMLIAHRQGAYDIALQTRDALKPAEPADPKDIFIGVTQMLLDLSPIGKAKKAKDAAEAVFVFAFNAFKDYSASDGGETKEGPPTRAGGATVEEIIDVMVDALNALEADVIAADETYEKKIDADILEIEEILATEGAKDSASRYVRPESPTITKNYSRDDLIPPYA